MQAQLKGDCWGRERSTRAIVLDVDYIDHIDVVMLCFIDKVNLAPGIIENESNDWQGRR